MMFDKPPKDKYNAVYFILLLHGIGVLMPWNMFITIAPSYYVNYKFVEMNADGTVHKSDYALHFLSYLGLASQIPNLLLNLINLFVQIKGDLRRRISFSLFVLAVITLITLIFTLINTSHMIGVFFFITMITVVLLNAANGVYQSSLYGLTATFPPQYTNALILGNNICGTFVSIVNIITLIVANNIWMAAFFYFLISLLTVFACFGSLFLLQKLEFYNYYMKKTKNYDDKNEHDESQHLQRINTVDGTVVDGPEINRVVPKTGFKAKLKLYFQIFRKIWIQCFNIWCMFFVTLTLFPVVMADIKYYSESGKYDFFIPEKLFTSITTYLLFNFFAAAGSFLANFVQWPSPKWVIVPVIARIAFIPLLIFCYFRPEYRTWNVWFYNVWIYIIFAIIMSISSGYFSSVIMMYVPRIVEPSKSTVAGMIAAFFLIFGITCGIIFTFFVSWFIDSAGTLRTSFS
ncbi:nucleoside transporter [Onchocerca flexuosa]|uniref:Nucleoside transporter n=2 Tax=Onchocerca flexuosa TaxID=387005 RepID=A0A238C0V2_9BILA|nr:nucleoside transporter [Onchocerca flexuosa]